ncbi:hypothetical protein SUGI_0889000 [Cryptomeria japonica]|nr:hypothetical protein SUGI_0889000 [Cryptomeria japonica]
MVSTENDGGRDRERRNGEKFDPSAMPPFTIADIRAAIPKHCWVKNSWRSLSYFATDVMVVIILAGLAVYFNSWAVWPLYWFAQGTMFWALFVIGHDCGHGSFSDSKDLNSTIGHLTHSFILVPYNGWRISHRTHHQNHGHVEKDESWHPVTEKMYKNLKPETRMMRFALPGALFVYPFYLWWRSPGKTGSHYNPDSDLFAPEEKIDVLISTLCWIAMASLLLAFAIIMNPGWVINLYVVPYWIFVMWLDLVTYLHHHGHDQRVPWYRGTEWSYLRGALSTIDRDYGVFNKIHHDIGTHIIHHLFPQIPHYNLVEATEAAKPVLGKYYRAPQKSSPFPIELIKPLVQSISEDRYVKDEGDVVFYQSDTSLKNH